MASAATTRVVCISSQDGTGTEEAAALVAEALGFRLINEEIVRRGAIEAGVDQEVLADVERRRSFVLRVLTAIGPASMAAGTTMMIAPELDQPDDDQLRGLIRTAIEETAVAGDAVIVAHAASLALGARDDVLRVLLTASASTRRERVAASLGVDEKKAANLIRRSDGARADYLKRFYGIGAEQPTHYDLVINTDRLGARDAARVIVEAAQSPG